MDSLFIDGGELFKYLYSQAASSYDFNGTESNINIYNSKPSTTDGKAHT